MPAESDAALPPIDELRDMCLETVLVENKAPWAVIVIPDEPNHHKLGELVNDRLEACGGLRLPIVMDTAARDILNRSNVIAIGNLATNAFIEKLYYEWYTFIDKWYPGKGGHVVRSLHDPYGTGKNVILLGGSDYAGLEESTERFCQMLRKGEKVSVGWVWDIKLGEEHQMPPEGEGVNGLLAPFADRASINPGYNSLSKIGLQYYYTGDVAYGQKFREMSLNSETLEVADHYVAHKQYLIWDLIEESPVFSDEDRLIITNKLLKHLRSSQAAAAIPSFTAQADSGRMLDRHLMFMAICTQCGARYFQKYYPSEEFSRYLKACDHYWDRQMTHGKAGSDMTRGIYTYLEAPLRYALLADDPRFVESGALREWADRCVMICNNEGTAVASGQFGWTTYPYMTLRKAACLLKDGSYLYAAEMRHRAESRYGLYGNAEFLSGQAFERRIEPEVPHRMVGVYVMPMDSWEHEVYGQAVSREEAFDKASFRSGFEVDDQFLLLDGVYGGPEGKPHADANSILEFGQNGRTFVLTGDATIYLDCVGFVNHNLVTVTKSGAAFEPPHAAAMEKSADVGGFGYTRSRMENYIFSDWTRHILWRKGEFFLVIDRLTASEDGDFSLECQWRTLGDPERHGSDFCSTLKDKKDGREDTIWIKNAEGLPLRMSRVHVDGDLISQYATYAESCINRLRQVAAGKLQKGESREFCNLIYATSEAAQVSYDLRKLAPTVVALDGDDKAIMGALEDDDAAGFILGKLHVKAQAFELTDKIARMAGATELGAGTPIFASDKPVDIEINMADGKAKVVTGERTSLKIGNSQGITLADGSHELSDLSFPDLTIYKQIIRGAFAKAAAPKSQKAGVSTSTAMTSIGELDAGSPVCDMIAADINGDSRAELLIGTEDGCAKAVTTEGEELWRIQTGSAVKALGAAGSMGVLVGSDDEKLYALDSNGKLLWTHQCEPYGPALKEYDWWTLERKAPVRRIVVEDVDSDGKPEILLGTGGMQVEMLNADGALRWRAPVFYGFPTTILVADLSGSGSKSVMAGCTLRSSTGHITTLNSEGKTVAVNSYPSGRPGWDLCGISFMAIADLHGDGKRKLLVARIGAYNQLIPFP